MTSSSHSSYPPKNMKNSTHQQVARYIPISHTCSNCALTMSKHLHDRKNQVLALASAGVSMVLQQHILAWLSLFFSITSIVNNSNRSEGLAPPVHYKD
ncbi:hypothetical protein PSHT_00569 [Puccinia striiformis]|uniref:Uncharacterized protein n=1 Tax=Puccinia striiformis TaxID=27350 RepID=A0A2S4WMQ1_9BASI|nr:hypothetical protein PSHT_00569 [Puccinia striiformis]